MKKKYILIIVLMILTLTSCKKTKSYTVTFEDGSSVIKELVTKNDKVLEKEVFKEGYQFIGWFENEQLFDFNTSITKDTHLVAKWDKLNKVTIDWGNSTTVEYVKNNDYLSVKPIEKEGYIFDCFLEDGNYFNVDDPIESDVDLTVKWLKECKISFVDYTEELTLLIPESKSINKWGGLAAPKKEGYSFDGYFKDSNFENEFKLSDVITSDMTIYVKWLKINQIRYDLKGGTSTDLKETYIEGKSTFKLAIPKKDNFYFRGWYDNENFSGSMIYEVNSSTKGNLELYAKWVEKTLENSYISFLGDSISTYQNYIPFASDPNSYYYPKYCDMTVNETWWKQTQTRLDAKLGINNSYSGTCVMKDYDGSKAGESLERLKKCLPSYNIQPDILVVFMGMNDSLANGIGCDPAKFKQSYTNMINNIYSLFPDIQLFLCTISYEVNKQNEDYLDAHLRNTESLNNAIKTLALEYNIPVIDFANAFTDTTYLADTVHPNKLGMTKLADMACSVISEFYNED